MITTAEGLRPLETFNRPSERLLGRDETIPIKYPFLDNPTQFLRAKGLLPKRLAHYRMFFWNEAEQSHNYCLLPQNAAVDTSTTLMLYADFAEPALNPRPIGLAMVGFESSSVEELCSTRNESADALVIGQYQTAGFASEREMMHFLGFVKYKELLTHFVEQLAWRLRYVDGSPIEHVVIAEHMKADIPAARNQLINVLENDSGDWMGDFLAGRGGLMAERIATIRQRRITWAESIGYNKQVRIQHMPWSAPWSALGQAKRIREIERDSSLQERLDTMDRSRELDTA